MVADTAITIVVAAVVEVSMMALLMATINEDKEEIFTSQMAPVLIW